MNRKWCRLLRAGAENNPVLLAAGLPQKIRAVSLGKRTVTVDGVRRLWTQVIPTGIEKKKARTLRQRAESACVSGKKFLLVLFYPQGRACERGSANKEIHLRPSWSGDFLSSDCGSRRPRMNGESSRKDKYPVNKYLCFYPLMHAPLSLTPVGFDKGSFKGVKLCFFSTFPFALDEVS